MDPRRLLRRISKRHGLGFRRAKPLLPLVERALLSPARLRDRLLALVDANLARKAGRAVTGSEALTIDLDEEVLASVATVLHRWKPPQRVLGLGGDLEDLFPEGLDLGDILG